MSDLDNRGMAIPLFVAFALFACAYVAFLMKLTSVEVGARAVRNLESIAASTSGVAILNSRTIVSAEHIGGDLLLHLDDGTTFVVDPYKSNRYYMEAR